MTPRVEHKPLKCIHISKFFKLLVRGFSDRLSPHRSNGNVEELRQAIHKRILTISDIYTILSLSSGTCRRLGTQDLNMRRIAAEFTPRLMDGGGGGISVQGPARSGQRTENFSPDHNRRSTLNLLLRSRKVHKFEDIAEIQAEIQAGLGDCRHWSALHAYSS